MTINSTKPGRLFIISAPSGAGKTTLCRAILARFKEMRYSISSTTRPPRQGEQDGVEYFFIDKDQFLSDIETGKWVEWAEVHGNYYGTSAEFLEQEMASGVDVLLDIDVQGAQQICHRYPESVTIFIMPPSIEILRQRLEARSSDREAIICQRLQNARQEMAQKAFYQHVVLNDQLEQAINELTAIISSYRK